MVADAAINLLLDVGRPKKAEACRSRQAAGGEVQIPLRFSLTAAQVAISSAATAIGDASKRLAASLTQVNLTGLEPFDHALVGR